MVLEAQIYNQVYGISLNILKAGIFLMVAAIGIRYGSRALRKIASGKFSEPVVVNLITSSGKFFMWFWTLLLALSILGFSGVATSMGTATGFVALGVAFALKNVISDTVAGAYLAQDKDFNSGDHVEVDGTEGEIEDVSLRKTRIRLENGNLRIINNSDAEKKWTKIQ